MATPGIVPTVSDARTIRDAVAHFGLAAVVRESCRDDATVLRCAARQPVRPASLRAVLAAIARLSAASANDNPSLPLAG